ncbi:class I SAM-dependent rRNA methyltransferase [Clostridium sp. LIBA-8841]|uniref:class I SAM-dependent rRNA methyltransferase n=1 Tax=Clostridium sp. LIBA-8841 TaxID=2987530 RepID=UPI002AC3A8EE|nr:class I SAM-dependent rRNA methyltransferase [Clostridium sp. LIBA-8841]MDZ5252177.1 class I SAM-dependent rRNA methyltransferase [Clostridium sp. LIBA-8841]
MKKEITIKVKSRYVDKFKSGYPLIFKEAIINFDAFNKEGELVKLVDEKNRFVARGYHGKQNKGYGWILSTKENTKIDISFFERKIISALNKRAGLYRSKDTNAFRVFNGEGDGIGGLTIDYFDGYYLINWYSRGIYKFRDEVLNSLKRIVEFKAIYQKKRFDENGAYIEEDGFIMGERGNFPIIVKENGVNFAIYLDEGAMVGVFLDQRNVRRTIRDKYSRGKNVLNTFSYTGAFSVYAALGGAKKTTSVDLANRSLPKTIEQFSINGIDYEAQDIVVEDVFNYFKYAVKQGVKYDLVILDPPSFAKSKKFQFSAAHNYKDLLKEAIAITEDNGVIVASTNCSNFNMKRFKEFIATAFREMYGTYKILEEYSLPSDFRISKEYEESDYLKVVFIKKIRGHF